MRGQELAKAKNEEPQAHSQTGERATPCARLLHEIVSDDPFMLTLVPFLKEMIEPPQKPMSMEPCFQRVVTLANSNFPNSRSFVIDGLWCRFRQSWQALVVKQRFSFAVTVRDIIFARSKASKAADAEMISFGVFTSEALLEKFLSSRVKFATTFLRDLGTGRHSINTQDVQKPCCRLIERRALDILFRCDAQIRNKNWVRTWVDLVADSGADESDLLDDGNVDPECLQEWFRQRGGVRSSFNTSPLGAEVAGCSPRQEARPRRQTTRKT